MSEPNGRKDGRKLYWYLLKVVLIATATRYPMYQVVSSLIRDPRSLVQCTQENPCNYVRVFPGTRVPGTGPQVIRVYNGMERPLFISEQWTHMFGIVPILNYSVIGSIEYDSSKTEAADVVMLADNGNASNKLMEFWSRHPGMKDAMQNETRSLPDYVSYPTYFGMLVCRIVTGIITRPSIWADEMINKVLERGLQTSVHPLQHIPSSYVSSGPGTTEAYCEADETKDQIKTHMDHGLSFWVYLCSLAGWLVFTVLHDFSLLIEHYCKRDKICGCSLKKTALVIGCLSFVCQTMATGACFSWSSGTLSIFVAPGPRDHPGTVCFYRLQHLQAFFALGTPLFLHYLLMAQLQLIAASFVKGDFLYTDRYKLPFSYVAGTKTWEKGQRLIHDVVGMSASEEPQPEKEETEETADTKWYRTLWFVLCLMDYFFLGVQVLVISPAGMVITKSVAEYTVKTLHGTDVIPKIVVVILWKSATLCKKSRTHELEDRHGERVLLLGWTTIRPAAGDEYERLKIETGEKLQEVEKFRKKMKTAREALQKAEKALEKKRTAFWKKSESRPEGLEDGKGICSFVNCVRGKLPGFPVKCPPGWHHELVSLEDINPEDPDSKEDDTGRVDSKDSQGEQSALLCPEQ